MYKAVLEPFLSSVELVEASRIEWSLLTRQTCMLAALTDISVYCFECCD